MNPFYSIQVDPKRDPARQAVNPVRPVALWAHVIMTGETGRQEEMT